MALSFQDVTIDTKTVSLVELGTGSDQWIQEAALSEFDKTHLEAALSAGLDTYTMPNTGMLAEDYFAPFIVTAAELTERFAKARVRSFPADSVVAVEQRVTALETP